MVTLVVTHTATTRVTVHAAATTVARVAARVAMVQVAPPALNSVAASKVARVATTRVATRYNSSASENRLACSSYSPGVWDWDYPQVWLWTCSPNWYFESLL